MLRTPRKAVQLAEAPAEVLAGEPYEWTFHVAEAHCYDCDEHYGPELAESVGEWLAFDHAECFTIECNWEETEVIEP